MSASTRAFRGGAHRAVPFIGCLVFGILGVGGASAAAAAPEDAPRAVMAGPPLADALRRFATTTGYDVVFPERLVEGKRAAPVRAPAGAHDALRQMLSGSGLVPRFTRPDAFVLEAAEAPSSADLSLERIEVLTAPFGEQRPEYRWYGEKLLQTSLAVLRRSSQLGFRAYDFTLYVWLSAEGEIVDLDGHGGADNQEALSIAKDVLRGLAVGTIPPANMPQPVGLRITAQ